jgi:hypothetical protein
LDRAIIDVDRFIITIEQAEPQRISRPRKGHFTANAQRSERLVLVSHSAVANSGLGPIPD